MSCCWMSIISISISSLGILLAVVVAYDFLKRFSRTRASLSGQHVVITGGSSGIGKEVAFLAAAKGANVTILARDTNKLEEACKEIRTHAKKDDQKINFFKNDVTDSDETEQVIQRCEVEIGPIDILINSAGYAYPSRLEDIPLRHIKGMMDINYMGTVNAIRSVLPSMKSRRGGKIVCVSSVGGLVGLFGYTGYCASKFAVRGLAEALQMEVKPYNISVTLSFPPDTDTPCLTEENKVKPTETKIIGDTAGVFQPSQVANTLLHDAMAGDFFSATGFDGTLATVMCAGMSPMSSTFGLIAQVLFMGVLRMVSLGYNCYFNHVVAKCASQKEKEKRAQ